jgi:hypothetical protein
MPEKVLLVCTSTEEKIKRAVTVIRERVFLAPQLDLLCTLKDLPVFEKASLIQEVIVFPPRHRFDAVFRLWMRIRRERYCAVAVLWCLDPGRTRPKLFALLCGGDRLLVFNENLDCDFLSISFLWRFLRARARDGTLFRNVRAQDTLVLFEFGYRGIVRLFLFPIRLFLLAGSVAGLYCGGVLRTRSRNVRKNHG